MIVNIQREEEKYVSGGGVCSVYNAIKTLAFEVLASSTTCYSLTIAYYAMNPGSPEDGTAVSVAVQKQIARKWGIVCGIVAAGINVIPLTCTDNNWK